MSEQYGCPDCNYVANIEDLPIQCPICGHTSMEHLRWTKGGAGSHWEGCEEVHWDCKIAQLEAELARLKTEYDAEVDQFNDGVAAGEKGGLDPFLDQPHYEPDYDEWRNGYYAGSYDRLTAELTRQKEENHALDQINRDIQTASAHLDEVLADNARRDEIIARLKEDAEKMMRLSISQDTAFGGYECNVCGQGNMNRDFEHESDCPITLHRALMKELE